jgi:hypothetical protein
MVADHMAVVRAAMSQAAMRTKEAMAMKKAKRAIAVTRAGQAAINQSGRQRATGTAKALE